MNAERIISITSGGITIFDFVISLVPTFNNSALELPRFFGGTFSPVRVLFAIFLEFFSLYALSAFCVWSLTNRYNRAFNNTMLAVFASLSAWITTFNIKEIVAASSINNWLLAGLIFLCFIFFDKLIGMQIKDKHLNDEEIRSDFYWVSIPMYIILWAISAFVH